MVFLAHCRHPWSSPLLLLFAVQAIEFRATTASLATRSAACNRAADIARAAQQLCGDVAIEEALRLVRLQPDTVRTLQPVLASLGLRTVLDLQLLAGGPDATALMQFISESDLANIGELAKIRLLVGDQEHLSRIASVEKREHEDEHQSPNRRPSVETRDWRPSSGSGQERRWLQEEGHDGMSIDTIAIVLSVLVGAAGYVVQAVSARHAERAAESSAQELQVRETRRQREHEQMLAQMQRTERIVDECCAPTVRGLWRHIINCGHFAVEACYSLEESNPEVIAPMWTFALRMYDVEEDGTVISKTSGLTMFHGTPPPAVVRGATTLMKGCPSTKSTGVMPLAVVPTMTQPRKTQHCMIMSLAEVSQVAPEAIIQLIETDPESKVAQMFRRFIRVIMLPGIENIAAILASHSSIVPLPNKAWLQEKFPEEVWYLAPESLFIWYFQSCVDQYRALVDSWKEGDLSTHMPMNSGGTIPIGGLLTVFNWCHEQGKQRQQELIGMTTADEEQVSADWDSYMTRSTGTGKES